MKLSLILVILISGSGCTWVVRPAPLCLSDRPLLEDLSLDEQLSIPKPVRLKVGSNDAKLKSYTRLIEDQVNAYNEEYKVTCDTENL